MHMKSDTMAASLHSVRKDSVHVLWLAMVGRVHKNTNFFSLSSYTIPFYQRIIVNSANVMTLMYCGAELSLNGQIFGSNPGGNRV